MIRGHRIVVLGTADWDSPLWTNQQHIVSRLGSAGNSLLYIESLGLRRPRLSRRDSRRMGRRLARGFGGPRAVAPGVHVLSPLVLPFYGIGAVRALNEFLLLRTLRAAMKVLGFERPILWAFSPAAAVLLGRLDESLVLYHCVDEIAEVPGIPPVVRDMERALLRRADLVLVTSPQLYESKRTYNPRIHLQPNVADIEHFSLARDPDTPVAPELAGLPRPVLGFVGALDDYKIDAAILRAVAETFPHGSIVLIGPIGLADSGRECASLGRLANVRLLGHRPYAQLPGYIRGFDAFLIPYRLTEYTKGVFPMKFFEALAGGCPIVATPLPALDGHGDIVHLASGPAAFAEAVSRALVEETPEKARARAALAEKHSWTTRLDEISALIEAAIDCTASSTLPARVRARPNGRGRTA